MNAGDAVSVGKNQKTFDYLVQWDGFTARAPGTYTFKVWLGDAVGGEFPIALASEETIAAADAGGDSADAPDAGAAPAAGGADAGAAKPAPKKK